MYCFRADANEYIGTGHMMRCLTIAQALSDMGTSVLFICADEQSARLPSQYGFATKILHTDYRHMEEELSALTRELPRDDIRQTEHAPVLIVDSYFVTDAYLAVLRAFYRIVLIDDNAERSYPADIVLNYNFHADREAYTALYGADKTRFLLGPFFAPVRAQFQNRDYRVRPDVKHILILSGGSDPDNAAGAILQTLRGTGPDTITQAPRPAAAHAADVQSAPPVPADTDITIVCGSYNAHAETLDTYAKKDAHLRVLHNVEDMASLMCESDLAVSACGSTTYELCAIGLPFVCYALADNQLPLAAYLDVNGPVPYAGDFRTQPAYTCENIAKEIRRLMNNPGARTTLCIEERRLVDGRGAAHIASQIS